MENENEQVLDVEGQEDTSGVDTSNDSDFGSDETVTISKSKFNSIRRKASAYDAKKDRPQINNRPSDDRVWKEEMELKVAGYTDKEELAFIMKNGGKASLENGFVKQAIESLRQQKVAEQAVLANEGQKSSVNKGFSQSDFSKLSADEQLKTLSQLS